MIPSDQSGSAALSAEGLAYRYPGQSTQVLTDLDFSAYPGERTALVGPSGCGKTTLLRLLEGSLSADQGLVRRTGKVVLIYQDLRLVAEDTALHNAAMGALGEAKGPLGWAGYPPEALNRARQLLQEVGLGGLESRLVSELSGGQRQRVAIARALCSRPDVLLADEPFASLDAAAALRVSELLMSLQQKHGFTLICSLHDVERVPGFFTRVIELCPSPCQTCPLASPAPRSSRGAWQPWALGALLAAIAISGFVLLRDAPPWSDSLREGARMIEGMAPWPPARMAAVPWASLLSSLLATIQMALLGTALGALASFPIALAASLPGGSGWVCWAARGVANLIRSVPALIWALVFVAILGIGPASGVAALAAYSTGYLTRLFTEELENADQRPAQALIQMGATRLQALLRGLVKPAAPGLWGAGFFVFEYNVRGASVLGLVGAGGIGADLAYAVEWRQFPTLTAGLLMIIAAASLLDAASRRIRRSLADGRGT